VEAQTCKKELVIEIPVDIVRREAENVTAQYARHARIPGFRRGHAPPTLVWRHFRTDIRNEVVQTLLPKFFDTAIKDQKWSLIGRPSFEELKFEDNQPLTCKATFEVYPEFELKTYKGLQAKEEPASVTDADVDQALEELRQHAATFEVVQDRAATDDDYVAVTYQGRDLRAPESQPLEVRDAVVHLGGKGTVPAFTENLRGAKPGEVREFEVTYAGDYPTKALAGKTLRYRVEIQSIKKKVIPPIDDELAKSVSEFATLAELHAKLREDLKERRKRQAEAAARQALVEELLKTHEFPAPEGLVNAQLDRKLERVISQLLAQGIDPRTTNIDWEKIRWESKPEAEKEVRAFLILQKIAEAEKIEVPEEEVDELIREMAKERQETPAALKTRLTKDGDLVRIQSTRRNQKALDLIYHNAEITRGAE
jgi:trigger factor